MHEVSKFRIGRKLPQGMSKGFPRELTENIRAVVSRCFSSQQAGKTVRKQLV